MNHTFKITDVDVFPEAVTQIPDEYTIRPTVKVIVCNNEGKIALVTNDAHGLFLLPGGGVESDDLRREAERECEEEINWNVEIQDVVATSEEVRNRQEKKYETTCFSAAAVSESPVDTRTEDEKEHNLCVRWFTQQESLDVMDSQFEKLKRGEVNFYNIGFNIVRDKYFIERYWGVRS